MFILFYIYVVYAVVDPLIGTKDTGHTFPGAVRPFGKVQLSPDAGITGWEYCSGYQYGKQIARISHTHLSGTGGEDGYDIGWEFTPFVPKRETAFPGYYKAIGPKNAKLELTVTDSCGLIKYSSINLTLDITKTINGDKTLEYKLYPNSTGYRKSSKWATHTVYFSYLHTPGLIITCIDHQKIPNIPPLLNFTEIVQENKKIWAAHLSVIQTNSTILETALYHASIHPSKYDDTHYTIFSTWDTFRAWNSLMIWLYPQYIHNWTQSMIRMKYMPIWEIYGQDTHMMSGTHSLSLVGEYVLKNVINVTDVWPAMLNTLTRPDRVYEQYYNWSYVPFDICHVATTMTLEHAYTDYVLDLIAKKYNLTTNRRLIPTSYKNHFSNDMFYNRRKDGSFVKHNFDRAYFANGFEEGSAWTYQWTVLHDFKGLISLHDPTLVDSCSDIYPCTEKINGTMLQRLDKWFSTGGICGQIRDISHCIGQYIQSNEPNHHVIYLYTVLGYPEKTCSLLKEAAKFYTTNKDGLPGNDDCGQTSAWILYAALGFYPVNPASGIYILGCPVYPEPLQVGKLKVTSGGIGPRLKYYFNGTELSQYYLTHDQILTGGHFHVEYQK